MLLVETIEIVAAALLLAWPAFEVALLVRGRARSADSRSIRGGAGAVWAVAGPGTAVAVASRFVGWLPFGSEPALAAAIAVPVVSAGLAVRLLALASLGPFYSVDVAFRPAHELVTRGLYRYVRHPAYAGLLLCFAGLGLASSSWLGLAAATLPASAALVRRIRVEERALGERFGEVYRAYCARTARLLPGLY